MKTIFVLSTLLMSFAAIAQSVYCYPLGEGLYTSLRISKPDLNLDVPWYGARLDNKNHQRQIFTLVPTVRNDALLFISKDDRSDFILKVPNYTGPGVYHSAEMILNEGAMNEEKTTLICDQTGDLGVSNTCQADTLNAKLFQAAANRDATQLEEALSCGADSNSKNKFGCTPLLVAADPFCGQNLPSPISYNPVQKSSPIIDLLTNNGALLEVIDPVSQERALHKYTKIRDLEAVILLLDLEADVDPQDINGYTPLMRAVEKNDLHLVKRFVEASPNLNLKNKAGETALAIAQNLGYKKLEPLLQAPIQTVDIVGHEDGSCSPSIVTLYTDKSNKIFLKANQSKMFLLTSSGIELNMMVEPGGQASQNVIPPKAGTFEFTCGVHGAQKQTTGKFIVE